MYLFPSCFPLTYQTTGLVFIHAIIFLLAIDLMTLFFFALVHLTCIRLLWHQYKVSPYTSLTCAPVAYHSAFSVTLGSHSFRSSPLSAPQNHTASTHAEQRPRSSTKAHRDADAAVDLLQHRPPCSVST
jgi:hypothetical protein